jgi:hypothetical protein
MVHCKKGLRHPAGDRKIANLFLQCINCAGTYHNMKELSSVANIFVAMEGLHSRCYAKVIFANSQIKNTPNYVNQTSVPLANIIPRYQIKLNTHSTEFI